VTVRPIWSDAVEGESGKLGGQAGGIFSRRTDENSPARFGAAAKNINFCAR